MEGTLEELRRISNCPEGATFSQLGLRKSVGMFRYLWPGPHNRLTGGGIGFGPLVPPRGIHLSRRRRSTFPALLSPRGTEGSNPVSSSGESCRAVLAPGGKRCRRRSHSHHGLKRCRRTG